MSGRTTVTEVEVDRSPDAMLAYQLAKTIHRSGGNPSGLFGLLGRLVQEESWKRLRDENGMPFASFTELVETPEPYGLGTSRDDLRKLIELRHPHEDNDPEWRERAPQLRDRVRGLLNADTPKANPRGANQYSGDRNAASTHTDTAAHMVATLKREAESDPRAAELVDRVANGEISRNAAAIQAGIRNKKIEIRPHDPRLVANQLRKHMTPEQIAKLIALLLDQEDGS